MKTGNKGRLLIQGFESCKLKAYPDAKTGGAPWTIGWGHTGPEVKPGLMWTMAQADAAFISDLAVFERDVTSLVTIPLTQNQFDALVSFAYNVGSDIDADDIAEGLGDSTLLKKLNAGDLSGAADEFLKWCKPKNLPGILRRRIAERALFLS